MRRCEDEKMFYRPPLLEEPCAQTLSGTMSLQQGTAGNRKQNGKPKMNKCEKVIFIFSQQSAFCEQDLLDNDIMALVF